jgi:hypothetical protein
LTALAAGLALQAGLVQGQTPLGFLPPVSLLGDERDLTREPRIQIDAGGPVRVKIDPSAPAKKPAADADRTIHDPNVKQAQCCGGLLAPLFNGSGGSSCSDGKCVPGRKNCAWCGSDTLCGRIIGGIYDCICCPDQCYEPRWIDEANAAFFQDYARPVTTTRIRYDAWLNYHRPDTAEYFWAKTGGGKGPTNAESVVDLHELSFYQEVAAGNFSFFVEMPYRQVGPWDNEDAAGFADLNLGTKTLLLDCELLMIAFQFRTYVPSGNFTRGLGTGHVSLEPSLLTTVKLAQFTYLQTQVAEWIPLGADDEHAGAAIHYHFAVNHAIWRHNDQCALIGTLEFNGLTYQTGQFTEPDGTPPGGVLGSASGNSFLHFGPGLRLAMCNKLDIGLGVAFGLGDHGPDQLYRFEFRYRY